MDQSTDEQPRDDVFPDRHCRLILIGKTGAGKSATGNTILGKKAFKAQASINSITSKCGCAEAEINGLKVLVMDTPGLADTKSRDEEFAIMITRSLCAVEPGPHAILLCLRGDRRFTKEEYMVIQGLREIFGKKMTDYLIVLFAGKDQLDSDYLDGFEEQLKSAADLDNLLNESNRRYLLFDNMADDATKRDQTNKLLALVKEVVVQNGGKCFRHKASKEIDETMRDMLKEELREKKKRTKPAIPGKKPKIPGKKPVGTHPKKALTPEEKPDSPGEKSVAPSEAEFTTTGNAMILTEESVDSEKAVTLAVEAVTISEMPRPAELGDSEVNQNKVEDEAHTTTTLSEAEGATEAEAAMSPESETHTQFPGRGGLETTEEDEVHTTTTLAEEEEDASEAEAVMEPESENQTQVPGRDVEETEEEAHTTTTLAEKEEEEDAGEAEAAMSHESETQTQFPDQEIQETEQEEPVYAVVKKNRDSEHKPTEETHTEQTPNEDGDKDTDNGNDLSHAEMQVQMRKKDIDELRQSGVVQQRLKRFSSEEQTPKDDPDETKFSRRQTFPKLTPTANPVARSNTAPRGTTPKFVQNRTGDDDVSNVTVATKDPRITSDPEKWLEDDKELRELLAAIPAEPGMSMKEKKQMIEDVLRRKIGSAPLEELTEAQRERLEASAKSIGQKIKEGMKKFAVNAIDQCRLM